MKKWILIIIIVAVIGTGAFWAYKKYSGAKKLDVGVADYKINMPVKSAFDVIKAVSDLASLTINADVSINLKNYSDQNFKVSQIKADIYTESGQLLASPVNPLSADFTIRKNDTTLQKFKYNISVNALIDVLKSLPGSTPKAKAENLLKNYFTNGKIGIKLIVKGFVTAEGITVDLNETLDI